MSGLPLLLPALAMLAGCAAPGAPRPGREQAPVAIADLRAIQAGPAVELQFTLPQRATDGSELAGPWRVEIYRQFSAPPSPPQSDSLTGPPAYTLAADTLSHSSAAGAVSFLDQLTLADFNAHQGELVLYRVRAQAGGALSALSNSAVVTLTTPPQTVKDFTATISEAAITMHWTPPESGAGSPATRYVVYRALMKRGETVYSAPSPVAMTADSAYRDADIEPGATYRYIVRSLAHGPAGDTESAGSAPVVVYVPELALLAPPTGVAAVVVQQASGSLEVDLSWAIGGEAGLAGYNIYRSEMPEQRGELLNRQFVVATAYRDTTVVPGKTYRYRVSAVSGDGKESEPAEPVVVQVIPPGTGQ